MMEMYSHTFNTHKYVKELSRLGLPENQAEFIINTILESKEYDFSKLATREQLVHLEEKLATKIDALEERFDVKLDALVKEMTKFATKEQLVHLEEKLMEKVETVAKEMTKFATKEELKAEIATSQNTILKWMIPFFLTIIGMVATIMFKILGH